MKSINKDCLAHRTYTYFGCLLCSVYLVTSGATDTPPEMLTLYVRRTQYASESVPIFPHLDGKNPKQTCGSII